MMINQNQHRVAPRLVVPSGTPNNSYPIAPSFAISQATPRAYNYPFYGPTHSGPDYHHSPSLSNITSPYSSPPIEKKITLQVVRHRNNRGSFNTMVSIPQGGLPNLESLKIKLTDVATTHGITDFVSYYRYSARGTKYTIENETTFGNIQWADERLILNIEEIRAPKSTQSTTAEPRQPRETKYQKQNRSIEEARSKLQKEIPIETQNKMSHRHWIQMSYLHATNPDEWTIGVIIKHIDDNEGNSNSTSHLRAPRQNNNHTTSSSSNSGDNTQINILLAVQSSLTRLEDRVNKMENQPK